MINKCAQFDALVHLKGFLNQVTLPNYRESIVTFSRLHNVAGFPLIYMFVIILIIKIIVQTVYDTHEWVYTLVDSQMCVHALYYIIFMHTQYEGTPKDTGICN